MIYGRRFAGFCPFVLRYPVNSSPLKRHFCRISFEDPELIAAACFLDQVLPEHERNVQMMEMWLKNDPKLKIVKDTLFNSGKNEEICNLERRLEGRLF